jgi:hypothetical protein
VAAICLQETIKTDFSVFELNSLSENEPFEWNWTGAVGHSSGTLIGVNLTEATIISKDIGVFSPASL